MKDSHDVSHHIGRGKDADKIVLVVHHTEPMFLFSGQQLGGVFHACVHVDCECFFGRQFPNRSGYDLAGVYNHFLLIFGVFHVKGKNGSGFFFLDKIKGGDASYQVVRDGVEDWSTIESCTKKRDNRLVDRVGSFQSARIGGLTYRLVEVRKSELGPSTLQLHNMFDFVLPYNLEQGEDSLSLASRQRPSKGRKRRTQS